MMSRQEALICLDIAKAAVSEANEAVLRKCELMPTDHKMVVLQMAYALLAQKHRVMAEVLGYAELTSEIEKSDPMMREALHMTLAAHGMAVEKRA